MYKMWMVKIAKPRTTSIVFASKFCIKIFERERKVIKCYFCFAQTEGLRMIFCVKIILCTSLTVMTWKQIILSIVQHVKAEDNLYIDQISRKILFLAFLPWHIFFTTWTFHQWDSRNLFFWVQYWRTEYNFNHQDYTWKFTVFWIFQLIHKQIRLTQNNFIKQDLPPVACKTLKPTIQEYFPILSWVCTPKFLTLPVLKSD